MPIALTGCDACDAFLHRLQRAISSRSTACDESDLLPSRVQDDYGLAERGVEESTSSSSSSDSEGSDNEVGAVGAVSLSAGSDEELGGEDWESGAVPLHCNTGRLHACRDTGPNTLVCTSETSLR